MRGARLRTARPHQEPVLGPPSALASGRQARPGPVHGVHQPGLGRSPAAVSLRGPRLRLLPLRARPVPAAPSAMGKGRPARHQRLADGPGLRSALTAAGCLPRCPPAAGGRCRPRRSAIPTTRAGGAQAGRSPGEFAAARADPGLGCEWIDVRCLPGRLRLEIQYVLQCRGDERQSRLRPVTVQQILRDLAATGAASLLERTEEQWAEPGPRGISARGGRQFTLDARARIEQLAFGSGWEVEYPRDKWRLRNLGIQPGKEVAAIDFAPISQPWLAALAKRWCRWRLSAGLSAGEAAQGIRVIRRFSAFLAAHAPGGGPASIDRPLLERYLADLSASLSPSSRQGARLGAERIPPGHPPARLGRRLPARHRGLLSRGLPQARPAASPGGRRPCDGPGREPREPGPLGQPRLPADHRDPDPLRAADLQRRQPVPGTASSPTPPAHPTCATTTPR